MLEGCRLRGTVALYRDHAADATITDFAPCFADPADPNSPDPVLNTDTAGTTTTVTVPAGQRIVLDLVTAGRDASVFPDPNEVKPDRPLDSYIHFGWGPHACAGMDLSRVAQTALFKAIVGHKGLRRAPGGRGTLKSMPVKVWEGQVGLGGESEAAKKDWNGLRVYMTPDQGGLWPVPSTMKVRWEE
jgi:hypothetical protein